jgi:hypothetical protein
MSSDINESRFRRSCRFNGSRVAFDRDCSPALLQDGLCWASDMTDAEWWAIAPLMPDECAVAAKLATFGMGRYQRFVPILLRQGGAARMAVRSSASR